MSYDRDYLQILSHLIRTCDQKHTLIEYYSDRAQIHFDLNEWNGNFVDANSAKSL